METFLNLIYLFLFGSTVGWGIEVVYRRFFSDANPEKKWINPGFCVGPYLPLYGLGLCLMYVLSVVLDTEITGNIVIDKIIMIVCMAAGMTLIEFISGILALKVLKLRLWDYSNDWGNLMGIICPKFSFYWAIIAAVYNFFVHPTILVALEWLTGRLFFVFISGVVMGIMIYDGVRSAGLVAKFKQFAKEYSVIIKYEEVKATIRRKKEAAMEKYRFFRPFLTETPLVEYLKDLKDSFEKVRPKKQKTQDKKNLEKEKENYETER